MVRNAVSGEQGAGADRHRRAGRTMVGGRGHGSAPRSLGRRVRLYAAAASVKDQPLRAAPRKLVLAWPAMVLIQANASSIRLRARCGRQQQARPLHHTVDPLVI